MLRELLRLIETSPEPLTTAELAARLGRDPSAVAGMLDWLVHSGRLAVDASESGCQLGRPPPVCGHSGACVSCPFVTHHSARRYLLAQPAGSAEKRERN